MAKTFADPVMDAPDVDGDEEAKRWDPSKLTAVVVGAGPTGCLAAHYLAMRGYRVAVVDKGPRPQPGDAASSPLVLTSRGAIAFEELNLTSQRRVGPTAQPLRGVWDMAPQGSATATATSSSSSSGAHQPVLHEVDSSSMYRREFVVDRSGLAADLIEAAEQRYPGRVTFSFNTELSRAELKNRVAVMRSVAAAPAAADANADTALAASAAATAGEAAPEEVEVSYDLLVGADGVDSTVRRIFKAKVKEFAVITPVEEKARWKAFSRLPRPAGEPVPGFFTHRPQEYLYEWRAPDKPYVRLFVDLDGSVAGAVHGLGQWSDAGRAAEELTAAYPGFPREWAAAIGEQVCAPGSPAPRASSILQCSSFYGPRAVLLGDSAHAVTGAMRGQGPSSAIESVRTLALVLRGAQDDLDKVPEVYSNVRGDAIHAMQMLEFMERTKGEQRTKELVFANLWYRWSAAVTQGFRMLSAFVGAVLHALLPSRFLTAAQVVARLADRRIGYSEATKMLQGYAAPPVMLVLGSAFFALFYAFANKPLAPA